eukprot:bmy_11082T0
MLGLFALRRKNIAASGRQSRVPRPPALLLRGFRVPEAEAAGPPGWTGRRKAGARRTVGSSGFPAGEWDQARRFRSARCRRGRHVHTLHWRGIGLFRSFPPLLNWTSKTTPAIHIQKRTHPDVPFSLCDHFYPLDL